MDLSLRERASSFWHAQRVKRMVRDQLGHGAQCLVSVRETICTDPGCEGPATEIRIVTLGFQEIRALVHKQPSQIVGSDVAAILLFQVHSPTPNPGPKTTIEMRRAKPDDALACAAIVNDWIDAKAWLQRQHSRQAIEEMIRAGIPRREFWAAGDPIQGYLYFNTKVSQIMGL